MELAAVQAWLDRYVEAWKSYDPGAIGDLFSEDAMYRYHPYDEGEAVERGRGAIVRSWVEPDGSASQRDEPGTYDGHYEAWAVDGRRAVAVGTSEYWSDGSRTEIRDIYHNVFLLEFDAEGRCSSFTELYMARPKPQA
jgi:hypothetical protein